MIDQYQDDLKAYLDGELSPVARLAVRLHLTRCASCREEIQIMTRLSADLQKTELGSPLDSALRARILGSAFADVQGPVFNAGRARRAQDRLLSFCFTASLVVNALFVAWVAHSDMFSSGALIPPTRETQIKVFKRPPPPKPEPKVKPPPPPKEQPHVKPPLPLHIQHVEPSRPQPPAHVVSVAQSTRSESPISMPSPPPSPQPTAVPYDPGPVTTPSAPTPMVTPPAPPPPAPVTPPAPPAPPPPPPPSPPPPPPVHKLADRVDPEIIGSFSDINLPFDPSTVSVTSVTVTWDVDANGRVSKIDFRPTGNSDLDAEIENQIRKFRFRPRVVNGEAENSHLTHTFELGG